jgi:glucose/arabinose dehydrogenase
MKMSTCKFLLAGTFFMFLSNTCQGVNPTPPLPDSANGRIQLPKGFGALVVIEKTGKARHLVVGDNGTIYVKLRRQEKGKGILELRDTTGDGKIDVIVGHGSHIGTGIGLYKNYLYASSDSVVFRYPIVSQQVDFEKEEIIVKDLPNDPHHGSKSITFDEEGHLYVNIGANSNACQKEDRVKGSKGMDPCPLLEYSGGVWQFDAEKPNQQLKDGLRFATGIRNAVALDWDKESKQLFALQHGRDQLSQLYPKLFNDTLSAELPSEEFLLLKKGSDFGWPYCYNDHFQHKKVLAPEYGGDGKKTGKCSVKDTAIMTFPGHWAPNDLLFYHGNQFPAKYKNGAFIAFHGSWNRAPLKQGGYFVAFVPFSNGKPSGPWEVFAEGFSGGQEIESPNDAKHRPMGLAEGPDGSLYISDSVKGKIWRVFYTGK